VLKAGAAYVPLDPEYPKVRLKYMLADAQPAVVLTTESLRRQLPQSEGIEFLILDAAEMKSALGETANNNPGEELLPEDAAYVIYTSGSTGEPKGVVVTQGNVTRLFAATEKWFSFSAEDEWTLFHSYAFDFSVWEIWGALLYGARLVVVPKAITRSPGEFLQLLMQEGVTVLNQTPSAFYQLMQAEEGAEKENPELAQRLKLRSVIFGGEALELRRLRGWYERHGETEPVLVNMYGRDGAKRRSKRDRRQHCRFADLRAGWLSATGGGGSGGGVVCGGSGAGAGLSEACRVERGAVRRRSLQQSCRQAYVSHGRSGAVEQGRSAGVLGPCGPAGEDTRIPDRAGRDRSGIENGSGSGAGGSSGCG
jgi:acyl-CoA synthetase (AMP-forming)/AMP-acid ligase II